MAPDADKLRQRGGKAAAVMNGSGLPEEQPRLWDERLCSLSSLKTTEVCIDGVIYDISHFDHPGGQSILLFGGNDVTVQYKMIHAHHTAKHLEKMPRVGKVVDYPCEYVLLVDITQSVCGEPPIRYSPRREEEGNSGVVEERGSVPCHPPFTRCCARKLTRPRLAF